MAQSKARPSSLERLRQSLTIQKFTEREEVLGAAQKEGVGSRRAAYLALAYAYQWYCMSIDDRDYMMAKFKSHSTEIKVSDVEKNDLFIPTVKLVFDFTEPMYYSRVSEYALVLQYIDKTIDREAFEAADYDPGLVTELLTEAGGIKKCAEAQRKANNPSEEDGVSRTEKDTFLQRACTQIYQGRKPITTVSVTAPEGNSDFLLMMGRRASSGVGVEVVEVINADSAALYALTKDIALQDASGVPDTLNLLAETLGFIDAFGTKETPITTVEKDAAAIHVSLDKSNDASLVVKVVPKQSGILQGFGKRAHLSKADQERFVKSVQDRPDRLLFSLQPNSGVATAEAAFDLRSNVNPGHVHTLHFNAMTDERSGQVVTKDVKEGDWQTSFTLDRKALTDIHAWTKGWLKVKRPKPADRIIQLTLWPDKLALSTNNGEGASQDHEVVVDTGYKGSSRPYRLFGREFVTVIERIWQNQCIQSVNMLMPDKGMVRIIGDDTLAIYTIDIPTVAKGDAVHNSEWFTSLQ